MPPRPAISRAAGADSAPTPPAVTVAVPTHSRVNLLSECLHAVQGQDYPGEVHLLVIDNGSRDGTAELLARDFPDVPVTRLACNTGFSGGANAALALARTPLVALLNDDATPRPDWLARLVPPLARDARVAAVTSKVLFADRSVVNSAGVVVFTDGYAADRGFGDPDDGRWDEPSEVFAFGGAAVLLRCDAVRAVGGFDPDFFVYYEDTDLSWRLRARGWRIMYEPTAVVEHDHAATSRTGSSFFEFHNERNRLLTLTKNATWPRVAVAVLRFPLSTVSLLAHRELNRTRLMVRIRVLASFLRLFPQMLLRRRTERRAVLVRRRVLERWLVPTARRRPDGGVFYGSSGESPEVV